MYISDGRILEKKDDSVEFYRRSRSFNNLYNVETGFFQPRSNGGWQNKFDSYEVNNNYTEANAWQYMFANNQSPKYYRNLHSKLDSIFNASSKTKGREQSDITGMIGQYSHGNEPSHHIAYMYGYTDEPWKTSYWVNKIVTDFYKNTPDGLIGNEDCGQMSAWYVWAALGAYPIKPGANDFSWSGPLFDKIIIDRRLNIIAHRESKNLYILTIFQNISRVMSCLKIVIQVAQLQYFINQ